MEHMRNRCLSCTCCADRLLGPMRQTRILSWPVSLHWPTPACSCCMQSDRNCTAASVQALEHTRMGCYLSVGPGQVPCFLLLWHLSRMRQSHVYEMAVRRMQVEGCEEHSALQRFAAQQTKRAWLRMAAPSRLADCSTHSGSCRDSSSHWMTCSDNGLRPQ